MTHVQTSLAEKITINKIENEPVETLYSKFGDTFQTGLLRSFVVDSKFWGSVNSKLTKELFSKYHRFLFSEFLKYFSKYENLPSKDIISSIISSQPMTDDDKQTLKDIINSVYSFTEKVNDVEYYQDTLKDFIRDKNVKDAFLKSVDLFNTKRYKEIEVLISDAVKDVDMDDHIGTDLLSFDVILDQQIDYVTIPTPFNGVNNILKGGLAKKELGLILCGTGAGKSWVMQTMGAHALLKDKNVIYYTFEMSERQVAIRFASILLEKNTDDVTGKDIKEISKVLKDKALSSRLFIAEYPTKSCSVSDIKQNLNLLYNRFSFKPDLILIDYADLMKTSFKYSEKRFELTSIYEELRGLCGLTNTAMWTISQVNRTGYSKKIVTVENIAEDYNKTTICDFILSIGRDIDNRVGGNAQAFIAKNRRGKDALKFNMDMQFNIGRITMDDNPEDVINTEEYKAKNPDITSDDNLLQNLVLDL